MGFASPLRAINVPIMVVVVTAPSPTHITPSLPFAGFTILSFIAVVFFYLAKELLFIEQT
jgi:hypothetical protein